MNVDLEKRPDAELGETPQPVDTGPERQTVYGTVTAWSTAERRPVLPAWVRNGDERKQMLRMVAERGGSTLAYHAVRVPWYATRSLIYAPRGVTRLVKRGADLWFDGESRPLRQHAVVKQDAETYEKLRRLQSKAIARRAPAAVGVFTGTMAIAVFVVLNPLLQLPAFAALIVLLGRVGQPADRPIVLPALVTSGNAVKPTSEVVEKSLRALGIPALAAKEAKIEFPHPIRVDGPGWRADVDLPMGATASMVMDKRKELAANLRRPLGCVWPSAGDEHPGRLILWVGMQDLAKARQPSWPLLKAGVVSLFDAIPFGTDQRGRTIYITLMFANMIIGAMPRMGKTFALRLILLAAALDPTAELLIWELKGTGDLACLKKVAHDYGSGPDDATLARAMACMRYVFGELERRAAIISKIAEETPDLCPENKVTPHLAKQRELGLHPMVLALDECQELYAHPDYKDEATRMGEGITKRGPALGIMKLDATQRPDAGSLPKGISSNAMLRWCAKVMDHLANDMVLGQSMHKNGIKATMFSRSDKGIGFLAGEAEDPQVTRAFFVDGPAAERISLRARAAREKAGTLSGYALGEQREPEAVVDVLADVRVVFATIERIWTDDLLERLAELRPGIYGSWTPAALAAALKPHAIKPRQVWKDGENRQGYRVEQVNEAMARRELTR